MAELDMGQVLTPDVLNLFAQQEKRILLVIILSVNLKLSQYVGEQAEVEGRNSF